MANNISIQKIKTIIAYQKYEANGSKRQLAKKLRISRTTLKRYIEKIKKLEILPQRIESGPKEILQMLQWQKNKSFKQKDLKKKLPKIHERIGSGDSNLKSEWIDYLKKYQEGYKLSNFTQLYGIWCKGLGINKSKTGKWRVKIISIYDLKILDKWRKSSDRREWEKAAILFGSQKGLSIGEIANKIDRSIDTVKECIEIYNRTGLDELLRKNRKVNEGIKENVKRKKSNLIKLIHETPSLHNINRASWDLKSLVKAYKKLYNETISKTTISAYIKAEGFTFRKAKETLTSPDPDFRAKLDKIKIILSNLKEDEKFFSVDEYGPFSVKIKGGRSIVKKGERKTYPQRQKSKGFLICTAALELSKNQISHFYSLKKNTEEMIKLLELLLKEYPNERRIFFSWDAASWHASKELYAKIEEINSEEYRKIHNNPIVELAPLPASAQFLNVIESVFSGMAKGIIHNSNYQSVQECKQAIDLYFTERNDYFKENPKKAGNKIWGKELVKPIFSDNHNCKDPKWR